MRRLRAFVPTRGVTVAERVEVADGFFSRLWGLLGRGSLGEGEGMLITPCRGVHTMLMRFPIDVLYIDDDLRVVGIRESIAPNQVGRAFPGTSSVLELAGGAAARAGVRAGDRLELRPIEEPLG